MPGFPLILPFALSKKKKKRKKGLYSHPLRVGLSLGVGLGLDH